MKYDFPMVLPVVFDRVMAKVAEIFAVLRARSLCAMWGVKAGRKVRFFGRTIVRTRHVGEICMDDGVVLNSRVRSNLVGITGPTILDTRFGGKITIGKGSGMTSAVISSKTAVTIGAHVKIGGNVRIFDHDFHALDAAVRRTAEDRLQIRSRPVEIGDDCFIGTNAIILKGTRLGARTIVAAGSVVSGMDAPPDSLVKGNPAVIFPK